VNCEMGKTSVLAAVFGFDTVEVADGVISGPSRASAWEIYPEGSSSGDGPVEDFGQLMLYPPGSFDGWTSKLILLTAA